MTALGDCGVSYLFANAGTDFPAIIEALAKLPADQVPQPVTIPHETAAVAMAHGFWLVTGQAQAVMVHVNVGLANAAMGVINAASDNIPMIVLSGRTPITETGRPGGRKTPIQYGQEMYDQTSLVRDVTKFTYEIRYPEQADTIIKRAHGIATAAPEGPVFVSLPSEPLVEHLPDGFRNAPAPARTNPALPDHNSIEQLATWIAQARLPVVLCQRGDPAGELGPVLSQVAQQFGLGIVEPFSLRNVLGSNDPAHLGYDPKAGLEGADLVIVLDSGVPWIEGVSPPPQDARIVHIGPDPQFARMPVRGYRCDLSITSDPRHALAALISSGRSAPSVDDRRKGISDRAVTRRADAKRVASVKSGQGAPMSPAWLSRCVSDVMDDGAVAFNELGLIPDFMALIRPNQLFSNPHSGGLGWALPAALGAQLADRDRLVIACIGDGSYMFANPVACHQIAEALDLPVLTIIKNNGMWNAVRRSVLRGYPDGEAVRMNQMPLTSLSPLPDFCAVAKASRAYAERVDTAADLPDALARALEVVRTERRQALLDVSVAATDTY